MSQIEDLQTRMTRALDRISNGVERWEGVKTSPDQLAIAEARRAEAEARASRAETTLNETIQAAEEARAEMLAEVQAARAHAASAVEQAQLSAAEELERAVETARREADLERNAAVSAAAHANSELDEVRETLADSQHQLNTLKAQTSGPSADLAKLETAEQELDSLRAALETANADAQSARDALEVMQDAASAEDGKEAQEVASLQTQLEDEKLANAQLQERVSSLRQRAKKAEAALEEMPDPNSVASSQVAPAADTLAALDQELSRLLAANTALEQSNADLREANAQGVGEPHLINKSMMTELESLRAARAVEAAETRAVLAAIEPLVAQASEQEAS